MSLHSIGYGTSFRFLVRYLGVLAVHVAPDTGDCEAGYAMPAICVRHGYGLSLRIQLVIQLQEGYELVEVEGFAEAKQALHQHPHQMVSGAALVKISSFHLKRTVTAVKQLNYEMVDVDNFYQAAGSEDQSCSAKIHPV